MTGIDAVIKAIIDEAEKEAAGVVSLAKNETNTIHEKYRTLSQKKSLQIAHQAQEDCDAIKARGKSADDLAGKKAILTTKQELLQESFVKARKKISELPQATLEGIYIKIIKLAAEGGEEVVMSSSESSLMGASVIEKSNTALLAAGKKPLKMSPENRDIEGIILKNGDVETNCTFDTLLKSLKESITPEIAKILFEVEKFS